MYFVSKTYPLISSKHPDLIENRSEYSTQRILNHKTETAVEIITILYLPYFLTVFLYDNIIRISPDYPVKCCFFTLVTFYLELLGYISALSNFAKYMPDNIDRQ